MLLKFPYYSIKKQTNKKKNTHTHGTIQNMLLTNAVDHLVQEKHKLTFTTHVLLLELKNFARLVFN